MGLVLDRELRRVVLMAQPIGTSSPLKPSTPIVIVSTCLRFHFGNRLSRSAASSWLEQRKPWVSPS